ncbi:unnamed protein product [Caenorhabditis sp. 36 PRJEB53466]|nr:unnamed protein product [Caenorhabditis sp. 36 PRJEB53466]
MEDSERSHITHLYFRLEDNVVVPVRVEILKKLPTFEVLLLFASDEELERPIDVPGTSEAWIPCIRWVEYHLGMSPMSTVLTAWVIAFFRRHRANITAIIRLAHFAGLDSILRYTDHLIRVGYLPQNWIAPTQLW